MNIVRVLALDLASLYEDLVMRLMTMVMERDTILIMVDSCASARFVKLLGSHGTAVRQKQSSPSQGSEHRGQLPFLKIRALGHGGHRFQLRLGYINTPILTKNR